MIRLAIIGCGYWGPNLIRNFHGLPNCIVDTICDLDVRRLKQLKALYPDVKTSRSTEEVFLNPKLDAVVIATPVHTHFPLAKAALDHDKHVLIEKPMTTSSEEAKKLVDLAEKKKRILMVDHTFVYSPAVIKMKEILVKKQLGRLCYFDSVRVNLGLFQQTTNVLWDLATHDMSIMDFLIGKDPTYISATGSSHIKKGTENIVYVTIRFHNGLIGHIHVNWLAPVKLRMTLLAGVKKMIVYNDMEPIEKIKVYDRGIEYLPDMQNSHLSKFLYRVGDMYSPRLDDIEALQGLAKHFLDCIEHEQAPITDGIAGLRIVKMLEAAEQSLKQNSDFIKVKL